MNASTSKLFNDDIEILSFTEAILDPRSYVLLAYDSNNIGVAYHHQSGLRVPVHLTENIFNWTGEPFYYEDLTCKGDFLLSGEYVVANISGICTGFSIKYSDDIQSILRPSTEVLIVGYPNYYHVYHIAGDTYREVTRFHIINNFVFIEEDNHFVCVDSLFTSIYVSDIKELVDYSYNAPKMVVENLPSHLRGFMEKHDFSKDV